MATKHGLRRTPEYTTWASMKGRCLNTNNPKYPRYGGRGITICPKWITDFGAFYADMGPKPSKAHSIDRIDNDGNYTPENCRWSTPAIQSDNRSTTRAFTYRGETKTLREFSTMYGLPFKRLRHRLEHGWDLATAMTTPLGADEKHVEYAGRTQSLSAWGREMGISGACVSERLRAGWDIERALTTPPRAIFWATK